MAKILICLFLVMSYILQANSPRSHSQTYYLIQINAEQRNIAQYPKDKRYLQIHSTPTGQSLSGVSVCNQFFGEIDAKGKIINIANSMMLCSPKEMEEERKILSILNNASIIFQEKRIMIRNPSGTLIFQKD